MTALPGATARPLAGNQSDLQHAPLLEPYLAQIYKRVQEWQRETYNSWS